MQIVGRLEFSANLNSFLPMSIGFLRFSLKTSEILKPNFILSVKSIKWSLTSIILHKEIFYLKIVLLHSAAEIESSIKLYCAASTASASQSENFYKKSQKFNLRKFATLCSSQITKLQKSYNVKWGNPSQNITEQESAEHSGFTFSPLPVWFRREQFGMMKKR